MKARSNQLGMRKNPDSPRVHGLRLMLNLSSFGAGNHSGNSETNKPSPPTEELTDAQNGEIQNLRSSASLTWQRGGAAPEPVSTTACGGSSRSDFGAPRTQRT